MKPLSVLVAGGALASSLAGCLGTTFPKTPAEGGPAWQEIKTEHFVVDTDLGPAESSAIVQQLENLRKAMGETVFGGAPAPAPRARVLALRQDEYGHFDRVNAGFFLSSALFQPMLITSPGGDWDTIASDVRKHELAHYVSSLYIDFRLQPKWFAEGLAGYLETTRYDEKTGAVEIGHHPSGYEYLTYVQQATPDELWRWDSDKVYPALSARLYETSWAIVHYLFDTRSDELLDYQRALVRGEDGRDAWNRIFPDLDSAGLDEVIKKYVHKRDFKIKKATVPPLAVASKGRALTEPEVLAWRAALYMALQSQSKRSPEESKKLALDNVAASLGRDESSFWAHQVNLFYFDKVPESIDVAKKALATEQDNWLAWLWYAEVLRRAKQPAEGRRAALTKSLELAPGNRIALTQLAWVDANLGNWPSALEAAKKAVQSPPVATDSMLVYSVALSYSGQCDQAKSVEAQLAKRLKNDFPKDVAAALDENRRACRTDPPKPRAPRRK